MRNVVLLGATGSIGRSALAVARARPDRVRIAAMAAGRDAGGLADAARAFAPRVVALADPDGEAELREKLKGVNVAIRVGPDAATELAADRAGTGADCCLSAVVGEAGLAPTLAAVDAGLDLALANKEALVAGGALLMAKIRARGVALLPVDSEHSALFQCRLALRGRDDDELARVWLTASGGPFRGWAADRMAREATPATAGRHPTWPMGAKITVDSATLANKALEVIEAHWLFGWDYDKIGVLVHPESIVHGLLEFRDGAILAQLGPPDMRVAIQYALTHPERADAPAGRIDLVKLGALHFEAPDTDAFPLLGLGLSAGRRGGAAPAAFNAANEQAVRRFLAGGLAWADLPPAVAAGTAAGEAASSGVPDSVAAVRTVSAAARAAVSAYAAVSA